jgi:phage host-nuclease inhibitor protein Gam
MARRKGATVDAVQSKEEAAGLLGRYAALSAEIDGINSERAVKSAVLDKDADERIARREEELKGLFARLKPWWEVAGSEIAPGKRSAELGSCHIGVRLTPPKLDYEGKEDGAIARLRRARLGSYVRTKLSLDRQALIAALVAFLVAIRLIGWLP